MNRLSNDIAKRIKLIRQSKGLNQQTLAARSGLARSYISLLENGKKVPAVATLAKIADALGVKVGILFEDDEAIMKAMIVPMYEKDIKAQLEANDEVFSAYSYIPLARQISRKIMDPYLITVLPGKKNTQAFVHKGEEFNYVLTGTLKFLYGDTAYTFKAGECFYIDSKISHNMEALNNEPVTMLSVNAAVINGS